MIHDVDVAVASWRADKSRRIMLFNQRTGHIVRLIGYDARHQTLTVSTDPTETEDTGDPILVKTSFWWMTRYYAQRIYGFIEFWAFKFPLMYRPKYEMALPFHLMVLILIAMMTLLTVLAR